jgi:PAS domain S-box-containing protein
MVLYQNKANKNIFGDHIGEMCYKAFEYRDNICEGCPLDMVFKDDEVHKTERRVTIDKGEIYVEITASPLRNSTGEIIAGVEVVRDITKRKQIEEDLKGRIEELEKFYKIAVNRELRIKEPRETVKQLELKLLQNI